MKIQSNNLSASDLSKLLKSQICHNSLEQLIPQLSCACEVYLLRSVSVEELLLHVFLELLMTILSSTLYVTTFFLQPSIMKAQRSVEN